MLIDITRPLHPNFPPWPGDRGITFEFAQRRRDGAVANVGHLGLSVHNGTHADAPYHYNDSGLTIDAVPLETYIGRAYVIDVSGGNGMTESLFDGLDLSAAPRILLRTGVWRETSGFPTAWPVLPLHLPHWLGDHGVRLLGLDAPSVDHPSSADLPIHHALDEAGIVILENLDLDAAPPGLYELIALPLRIQGGDGSPIRAVLRTLETQG